MNAEEKQALIEFIKREKATCEELDTRDFVEPEMADFMRYNEVLEIALAALAAQPVQLPERYDISSMIDVEKDDDGPLYLREDVIEAIRAAGYEVQE